MSYYQIISIIVQILILIFGLYLAFFKSYFSEKGKNLATKEDIEHITKKVESIKTEFIKETEKLKHDLQFENQLKISFTNDLKNSIVRVYEDYNSWYDITYDSFLNSLNSLDFSVKQIAEAEAEINRAYSKFEASVSKLELYIKNNNVDKIIEKISDETYILQEKVEDYFMELEEIIEDEEALNIEFSQAHHDKKINLFNKTSTKLSNISYGIMDTLEELRNLFHELLTEKIKK
ncbi:MAG: hypothetical protein SFY56_07750 [Bacteroidota bacterium]|nr:hypothetical protein [Bacteroidota bacterium]